MGAMSVTLREAHRHPDNRRGESPEARAEPAGVRGGRRERRTRDARSASWVVPAGLTATDRQLCAVRAALPRQLHVAFEVQVQTRRVRRRSIWCRSRHATWPQRSSRQISSADRPLGTWTSAPRSSSMRLVEAPAHDTYLPHDRVSIDRGWEEGRRAARRRDFLFYVVGSGVFFALIGLVGVPLDWQSPSWLQRLGNFGIMFGIGALLGFRMFVSRPSD